MTTRIRGYLFCIHMMHIQDVNNTCDPASFVDLSIFFLNSNETRITVALEKKLLQQQLPSLLLKECIMIRFSTRRNRRNVSRLIKFTIPFTQIERGYKTLTEGTRSFLLLPHRGIFFSQWYTIFSHQARINHNARALHF